MKKILVLVGLLTSMYAIPPCDLPDEKVCTYLYKGAMSAEIIITNLSNDTIVVNSLHATLDGKSKNISGLKLAPGRKFTILQSRYDDYTKKPYYYIGSMRYNVVK